jgi:glycosyltransferase involved in cell wall biosynthesis
LGYSGIPGLAAGTGSANSNVKTLLFANTAWYLYNFRLPLAEELRSQGYEVVLVSPNDEHAKKLVEAGFHWIEFPFSRKGQNPLQEVVTIFRLAKVYKSERPDFVHHFTIKCVVYGSLAAKWCGVRRIINAITGLGYVFIGNKLSQKLLRPLIFLMYRVSLKDTKVIFQNQDDLNQFRKENLVNSEQSTIIRGSGVDIKKFQVSPLPEKQQIVLPARMLWDKGVGEFVLAARQLRAEGINAQFILAGDTDNENPAAVPLSVLNEWQNEGMVDWIGWQPDMPAVYASASIVCLPSYREGLPKTLIEAAACGRPLVAADVPGSREVVIPHETGYLATVKDVPSLANCLRVLLNDKKEQERLGANARRLVEAEFSSERIIRETLSVYNKLQGDGKTK